MVDLNKLERWFSHFIVFLIFLSVVLIAIEFNYVLTDVQQLWFNIIDFFIILMFLLDLIIEYIKINNFNHFIRHCWLDILAVIPLIAFFRPLKVIKLFRVFKVVKVSYESVHLERILCKQNSILCIGRLGRSFHMEDIHKRHKKNNK